MITTLYIDLDGTILNVRERLYRLHHTLIQELGQPTPLPKQHYLDLKRARVSEEEIIKPLLPKNAAQEYHRKRKKLIESPDYLKYDCLFPWSKKTIDKLRKNHTLILVTKRQSRKQLLIQLHNLGIDQSFDDLLVNESKSVGKKVSKAALIRHHHGFTPETSCLIGDTEDDLLAGKELGIMTIAVLSGLRNRAILSRYQPNHVVENISELGKMRGIAKNIFCICLAP